MSSVLFGYRYATGIRSATPPPPRAPLPPRPPPPPTPEEQAAAAAERRANGEEPLPPPEVVIPPFFEVPAASELKYGEFTLRFCIASWDIYFVFSVYCSGLRYCYCIQCIDCSRHLGMDSPLQRLSVFVLGYAIDFSTILGQLHSSCAFFFNDSSSSDHSKRHKRCG